MFWYSCVCSKRKRDELNSILKSYRYLKRYLVYKKSYKIFELDSNQYERRFRMVWKDREPLLYDSTAKTGFDEHYVYHLAWASRLLKEINPSEHIDIGSSIYFPAMMSSQYRIKYFEYRPPSIELDNLEVAKADLCNLSFSNESIKSLSTMHVVEHIGLGRYGDKLDYNGDLKAIKELIRVLKIGGHLLFVVPVGKPKIIFNAHRIYSYEQILEYFSDLELKQFSLIPDEANQLGLILNATQTQSDKQNYGCGCFWFKKQR